MEKNLKLNLKLKDLCTFEPRAKGGKKTTHDFWDHSGSALSSQLIMSLNFNSRCRERKECEVRSCSSTLSARDTSTLRPLCLLSQ